jgi:hypothetical protein
MSIQQVIRIPEQIIWTVLPNGFTGVGNIAKLSVFVSPRLSPSKTPYTLSEFPDFITSSTNWVDTVIKNKNSFVVQFDGYQGQIPATLDTSKLDPAYWNAIFNGSTYVEPYVFDHYDDLIIRSYPASSVNNFLKTQYDQIANSSPTEFVPINPLKHRSTGFGQIATYQSEKRDVQTGLPKEEDVVKQINATLAKQRALRASDSADVAASIVPAASKSLVDLTQLELFLANPTLTRIAAIQVPEMDFHKIVSSLSQYPALMRRLGLILDFTLNLPVTTTTAIAVIPGVPVSTAVQISVPKWQGPGQPVQFSPRTKCTADAGAKPQIFAADPAPGSDIAGGLLQFGNQTFDVLQVDLEGAALKALTFANNLYRMLDHQTVDTPNSASVPSLRSGGISVAKIDRAYKFASTFTRDASTNVQIEQNASPLLYYDDIVRGVRIDVWDSKFWHPLCNRYIGYQFLNNAKLNGPEVQDEGWISSSVTKAADNSSKDLRLGESLFRWAGWSLVAPRPGKSIDKTDSPAAYDPKQIQTSANIALPSARQLPGLTTYVRAPGTVKGEAGTLPRLRFGTKYAFRARVVDLAGNGLRFADLDPNNMSSATAPIVYGRFEPVSAPSLILRRKLNPLSRNEPADAQDSAGESMTRLVIRSNYNVDASKYNSNLSSTLKKISPPVNSNYMDFTERHIFPPRTTQLMAETHGKFDTQQGLQMDYGDISKRNEWKFQEYKDSDNKTFPMQESDVRDVDYLPDPSSKGAYIMFTDFLGNPIPSLSDVKVSFYDSNPWPQAQGFRIKLVDAATLGQTVPLAKGPDNGVVTIYLPKAFIVKARLSSYLEDSDLQIMGIWEWFAGTEHGLPPLASSSITKFRDSALKGQVWMLTPYRELVLVHAVQQPLIPPDLSNMSPVKLLGKTYATFHGGTPTDGKSTIKLDILAEWDEPSDPSPGTAPYKDSSWWDMIHYGGHVYEFKSIPIDATNVDFELKQKDLVVPILLHEFSDTKYRHVKYWAKATTRFLEYIPEQVYKTVTGGKTVIDDTKITQSSKVIELDIPNSARPAAPKVLYVVPTFGWNRPQAGATTTATTITSQRLGGGLRVYLDRPWFSSGDKERLGALIWPGQGPLPDVLRPYASAWGNDPIWISGSTPLLLSAADFTNRIVSEDMTDLTLNEFGDASGPNTTVAVASHEVGYDHDRQLWYCDIVINPGKAYYPFVRLALARYQPNSVYGAHLSRVVLADFAQLTPDRTVTVAFDPSTGSRNVSVSGVFPAAPIGVGNVTTRLEVTVLQKSKDISDDYLAWAPASGQSTFPLDKHQAATQSTPETWSGSVTFQSKWSPPFRLLIKEYELFISDEEGKLGERIVFAETIDV